MSQKNQENNCPETKPLISIVVPAYNEEKRIARCISALLHQDFPIEQYEIIVVDNNSNDHTAKIAQAFNRVKVVIEAKQGVGAARQAGWSVARGEIIASTDADCEPPKYWLKKIWSTFEKEPELVGISAGYLFYDQSMLFNFLVAILEVFFVMTTWLLSKGVYGFTGNNMAARRWAYLESGGFDPERHYGEDMDLASRLQKLGKIRWFFGKSHKIRTSSRRYKLGPETWHLVPYFLNFLSSSARNKTWRNELKDIR